MRPSAGWADRPRPPPFNNREEPFLSQPVSLPCHHSRVAELMAINHPSAERWHGGKDKRQRKAGRMFRARQACRGLP